MPEIKHKRSILKVSGEALSGQSPFGIDIAIMSNIAKQIKKVNEIGAEVAIVVGGGNFWRGVSAEENGMDRVTADYAGMLATVINALALQDALEREGVPTRTQSAIEIRSVAEPYIRRRAIRHLEKGRVIILTGGTGNPYFTTDTAAALRAIEIGANVLLMAKNKVDGVYDADPRDNPQARRFEHISYLDALNLRLEVMDSTALSLCMDNHIPIIVFDLMAPHSIERVIAGEPVGTVVSDKW